MEISLSDLIEFLLPNDGDTITLGSVQFINVGHHIACSIGERYWDMEAMARDASRLIGLRSQEFTAFIQARKTSSSEATTSTVPPRTLEEIYRDIPAVHCKGLCQGCCTAIFMSEAEAALIYTEYGELPVLNIDEMCSMLDSDGRCRVYENRPLICRAWGATRAMVCPHGCRPIAWLTNSSLSKLMLEAKLVTGRDDLYFSALGRFVTSDELEVAREQLRGNMSPEERRLYER